ncbi:hypothetical protein M408DRAFT_253292 [Serendipita vermifera MAFF 305830]|uniref:Uncharacterized protein n=1 Tax=Serendipita vermifera MAFF 305830 TaxID=933852 RepID=A0A0C3AWC2_SERVB|nr:hypothetical protein M408DRAFT_253292 [Serendipita vermifera MAFF 305830]
MDRDPWFSDYYIEKEYWVKQPQCAPPSEASIEVVEWILDRPARINHWISSAKVWMASYSRFHSCRRRELADPMTITGTE